VDNCNSVKSGDNEKVDFAAAATANDFHAKNMHWLDSTILAVLAAAAVLGAYSGFLMQVFRLVGFGFALYGANCFYGKFATWLHQTLLREAETQTCALVAYGLLFLGIYLAVFLFTLLLERGLRATQLQFVNRCLGGTLAIAKVSIMLGAICFCLQQLPYQQTSQIMEESVMAPILARGIEQGLAAVPEEYKSEWHNTWQQIRDSLPTKSAKSL
jgi:uncharacterized membrane protein required for colicin V production